VERDYEYNIYLYGGQLDSQTQSSKLEETKELELELNHLMVVRNDVFDYKPKMVVEEENLTVD